MRFPKWVMVLMVVLVGVAFMAPMAMAKKKPSLAKWKAAFDYSKAKYKIKVSNVSHPAIKGVYAGFAIRDALWKATGGKIYFEFLPFSMLGGEVEVLNQLQMGAVQGMAVSSVAATNLGARLGLVNLPFLVNTYEKLEKLAANKKLFSYLLAGMEHQGIIGMNITGYGQYGWATTIPVKSIADAKEVKFRIAEAAVNKALYKAWGFNPVVMPWPDVPTALKQGVITGLDHTLLVCYLTRKFEVAKNFTAINYAQGLFYWMFNKRWFNKLPKDLQKTFRKVVNQEAAKYRAQTKSQEAACYKGAQKAGVKFWKLPAKDMAILVKQGDKVHKMFAKKIGKKFLAEVQKYLDYGK